MKKRNNKLTYEKSGVNIKNADKLIGNISKKTKSTHPNVLAGIGGFSSLYALDIKKYKNPVIVCGTDGVGTKLKLASQLKQHKYIGQDLLAMCVNDVITSGATPLFFLDYLATSKVDVKLHTQVLGGIKRACESIDIPLIGGETAEMPGMYNNGDFDLAGFAVGALNRGENLPKNIKKGDILIGIGSSGIHSNGFSLVRKIIRDLDLSLDSEAPFSKRKLGIELLEPTRIYVKSVLDLHKKNLIKGLAHITGGGLTENVPRILNKPLGAEINLNSIVLPEVFQWLLSQAKLEQHEALKTFNCGIGMVLVVSEENVLESLSVLQKHKEKAMVIGEIIEGVGVKYSGVLPVN